MDNTKALEQKLEELIQQLNELLKQLEGQCKPLPPVDTAKTEPKKTVENLERELQRLKARREANPEPQLPNEDDKKNGWNYVSSYLQNRF